MLSLPVTVHAQYYEEVVVEPEERPAVAFVEALGGWGVQLGRTDYLPDGAPDAWQHPFVTGWTVGGAAGWIFARDLALVGTYEYRWASSREGDIPGAIDKVQGETSYHTASLGLRFYRPVGMGRLRADFGVLLAFPFETRLEYDYSDVLAAAGLPEEGRRVDEYTWGIGVRGQIGYEISVGGPAYVAFALGVRAFQSNNDGEKTEIDDVIDLAGMPPTPTTTTIRYGDGPTRAQPTTYSAQDVDVRLAIGARF